LTTTPLIDDSNESSAEEELSRPAAGQESDSQVRRQALTLLASIFVIAGCGLIYELLIATVSSYLLGSSVTQFSLSIGVFIGAMGLGSHLSQRVTRNLLRVFILTEVALAFTGGASVFLLFGAYSLGILYWVALYAVLVVIGALTGLELPLLTRLLKPYGTLRTVIAQALSFDYVGALVGSLLFPLLLLPSLGMSRTACFVGLLNIGVAAWNVTVFRPQLRRPGALLALCGAITLALAAAFTYSVRAIGLLESRLYEDQIVYTAQTRYQRIVITRWRDDVRLYLDGNLQFASTDEYRYHEALIHPALSMAPAKGEVLVLGGGDGLAIREILKHSTVERVTLVDIDPAMTRLGQTYPALTLLNQRALSDPRVRLVHQDAYKFLEQHSQLYDVIVSDLPDPNSDVLAKLYSREFYRLVHRHLAASGLFVTQATSPLFAREAFWCIENTIQEAGLHTAPYHAYVPSFGEWGFVLAAPHAIQRSRLSVTVPTRFLTAESMRQMFVWGKDTAAVPVDVSTLDRPTVLHYYLNDWKQWE
jgi:spermidine synthase